MKLSNHRQAITIFSIAIPSILIIGLLIAILNGRSKLDKSYAEKEANYKSFKAASTEVVELEALLSLDNRREKVAYWNSKLDQDFIQTISTNLSTILSKFDDSVLKQTAMTKAQNSAAIGSRTENPHSMVQLSFEGGFKPMQLLLAELEREMPNLVLESLSIKSEPARKEGESGKLGFTVVYLCWEKPKA